MDPNRIAAAIADVQLCDGSIPHYAGGPIDPWNQIEAAMGLDTVGRHAEAAAALRWLARQQNADGSWFAEYNGTQPTNTAVDSNFTAYVAVGCHHHFLSTQDSTVLEEFWPTVDAAIEFVLSLQQPSGAIPWRRRPDGTVTSEALVAGCSSIHQALLCAHDIATCLGHVRPNWLCSARRVREAIVGKPELFVPKPHAMDWYYPVLGGVLSGQAARSHINGGWERFFAPGHGVRCVDHEPWVTVAETAETALTLAVNDDTARARALLELIGPLETPRGDYWTGYNYRSRTIWPEDRTTWTAGAVLLAHAANSGNDATATTFSPRRG